MTAGPFNRARWATPDSFPGPPVSRLHVWRIDLSTADAEVALGVLDREERERAGRLRVSSARTRFITSRAALRGILAGYVGEAPRALSFTYDGAGKPSLAGTDAVAFNLSHSGDLALCAVSGGREVGVDLEELRPLRDVERLVERHFSASEREAWARLAESDRLDGFYRVWTRKEAMLKAAGIGLARPLERVDSRTGSLDGAVYWVSPIDPGEGYAAAVACGSTPELIERFTWALRA